MAGTVKRLSKVARELNVGISTLVDFLNTQGIEIDSNPNTKLEEDHVEILREQFADDQSLKEEAKKSAFKREKRETISLKTKDQKKEEEEDEDLDVEEPAVKEEPVKAKSKPEETEKSEKPVEKVKDEEQDASPAVSKEGSKTIEEGELKVSVVGKIDLSKINVRTRPDKKSKEEKEEAKKERAEKQSSQEIPAKKEEAVKEEKEEKKEPKKEVETIKVDRQKLSGPTVVGKIDLPTEDKRSSKDSKGDNKRKRKRIKKVDVNKQSGRTDSTKGRGKKKPEPKKEITEKDIEKEIKETLARLSGGGKSKGAKNRRAKRDSAAERRERELEQAELEQGTLKLTEFVSVSELAAMMDVQSTQVISACMSLGIFASINQRLDAETIQIIAEEFGFDVEFVSADVQDSIPVVEDAPEDLVDRPPIITVMGHVDHGKTSLLDFIRNANIAEGEAGGITQHIGAYSVKRPDGKRLTFLDTPGHEAFTAMRARGAQVTDVAIIIVAADDDVMPQTKEAISHAQAAGVPMVFAINKIDKPGANPDKIKEQLSAMNILVEDWGGKYQAQEISAKKGTNIDELLEKVILEADLLELKANPNKNAVGTIIESSLDKGKGYVTNVIVEQGTLKIGDVLLAGRYSGRVRAMHNEHGKEVKEAKPSAPVSILGINGAPSAGDTFYVMDDEREARNIATRREQLYREQGLRTKKHITL
ncbi:MAG: translation initiation factor IF-2, partial [Brumimicrobium sp.]|nr:translation initiation factor IF-2 [Brumimicrobium sp.]